MSALLITICTLMGSALLLGLAAICRQRSLPRIPLLLPQLALLGWWLKELLPVAWLPPGYRLGLGVADNLLLTYAVVRLLLWLLLELPGGLGWWRRPPDLLVQLLTLSSWGFISVLVVRQTTQFDLVNLVATSAVLTAVIGLAGQEGLKDLFSGLQLQLTEDFAIGDWLELANGRRGTVEAMSWRETRLSTMDGTLLVVPNSRITADAFFNRSRYGAVADRFEIALSCEFPPGQAMAMMLAVIRQHEQVLTDPAPDVRLKAFLEASIAYELQVWQKPSGDRALLMLRSELQQQIWYALHRRGQSLPYPVRELHRRGPSPQVSWPSQPSAERCQELLAAQPLFSDLRADELEMLVTGSQLLGFGVGEAVVLQGEEGHSLYCLVQGRVDVIRTLEGERQQRVRQLQAGDVFGEMTLLLDLPRSATVRAVEECQLLQVERAVVSDLLERNPSLLDSLARLVNSRRAELEQLSLDPQVTSASGLLETMRRLLSGGR